MAGPNKYKVKILGGVKILIRIIKREGQIDPWLQKAAGKALKKIIDGDGMFILTLA